MLSVGSILGECVLGNCCRRFEGVVVRGCIFIINFFVDDIFEWKFERYWYFYGIRGYSLSGEIDLWGVCLKSNFFLVLVGLRKVWRVKIFEDLFRCFYLIF